MFIQLKPFLLLILPILTIGFTYIFKSKFILYLSNTPYTVFT